MSNQVETEQIQAHVFISGRVQGVGFRWSVQRQAQQLELTGWVRNLIDGRVEALFEGEETAIKKAIAWCHRGDPPAKVDQVEVNYQPATRAFKQFRLRW